VLLVSTDPASNLDEVLGVTLSASATAVPDVPGLCALDIDPGQAARAYRERVVGPYRGVLPAAAVASIEEQLSGACTVEIAAFDEFSKLLGDANATRAFDHVIFDTAPTGHTLRLLESPAAWSTFIETNVGGTSCLGPLSGLEAQQSLYAASHAALRDEHQTTLALVGASRRALARRGRAHAQGASSARYSERAVDTQWRLPHAAHRRSRCRGLKTRGRAALEDMPVALRNLPRVDIPLLPFGLVGAIRFGGWAPARVQLPHVSKPPRSSLRMARH
jgi:arsenite-transporting ATPase